MFSEELRKIKAGGLYREMLDREGGQGRLIKIRGRMLLNFASNDYLGLASNPKISEAACDAVMAYGAGAGASRLLSGGCELHAMLEERVRKFKSSECALIFNSGYALNTGLIPALADEDSEIFSDELNHASLIDGIRLSGAKKSIYPHSDADALRRLIGKSGAGIKIIVTDTVFSMDGDIARVPELLGIARDAGAVLYLDDAHGTGVLGRGRGALSHFGIRPGPDIVQMGTFSKALGSFGAFMASSSELRELAVNRARSLIYSTALPPPVIAASLKSLDILERGDGLIDRLWENRKRLCDGLSSLGFDTGQSDTPIIPVMLRSVEEASIIGGRLFDEGFYAPAIRPPTVKTPRLRLTVTASHTDEDIEGILSAFGEAA